MARYSLKNQHTKHPLLLSFRDIAIKNGYAPIIIARHIEAFLPTEKDEIEAPLTHIPVPYRMIEKTKSLRAILDELIDSHKIDPEKLITTDMKEALIFMTGWINGPRMNMQNFSEITIFTKHKAGSIPYTRCILQMIIDSTKKQVILQKLAINNSIVANKDSFVFF